MEQETREYMDAHISGFAIAIGNVADGFEFIGPFKSGDDAYEVAHKSNYARGLSWWIVTIHDIGVLHNRDNHD